MNIREKLFNHRAAIIFAVFVSLIVAFPQFYFRIEHKADGVYQGIELLPDSPWSARVREIQDGNGFGSIYYKDGKSDPYLHLPLGSMTVAYMGKLFSFDINNTLLLSRLTLPFVAFLLIYGFVYLFSRDRLAALSSGAVILLADSLLNYSGISRTLQGVLQGISPSSFLELARPVYSLMIFVPFFGFLASFWLFYRRKNWRWGAVSTIILGLNFYNYFYIWTYLYAFGALLILLFLVRRKWREALRIAYVFLGALIVAIPYMVNLYRASSHPLYDALSLRHGIVSTHTPLFIGFIAVAALVIFLLAFPREDKEKYFFGLSLLLAPMVTMNQQIITGMVLQTGHYHWYFHKPIAVIFILVTLFYLLAQHSKLSYKKILAVLIVSVSFAAGFFIQAASYFNDRESRDGGYVAIERQKYGPVVKWLGKNAAKEAVVFANEEASQMTVIYTPLNVFHHRSAQLFLSATEERLLDAVFTFYRLRGVGKADAQENFAAGINKISADVYGIYYRESHGSYGAIPDEKFEEIVARYKETLRTPTSEWLREIWTKYEVEYLIWDKIEDPLWKLDQYSFLKKEADFGTLAIYSPVRDYEN